MKTRFVVTFYAMALIALFSASCVGVQSTNKSGSLREKTAIRVAVTESDGQPVSDVRVLIDGNFVGQTDANGFISASSYLSSQITASKSGYHTNTIMVVKAEKGLTDTVDRLKEVQTVVLMRDSSGVQSTYARTNLTHGQERDMSTGLGAAILRVTRNLTRSLPNDRKIAVLGCTAEDIATAEFVMDGVEQQLFDGKYSLVDRADLDKIRAEQNFQLSGEVDDAQAVSIGKMAAARIVITGRITKSGNLQRLTLRVLDVETGEIISRAGDQF